MGPIIRFLCVCGVILLLVSPSLTIDLKSLFSNTKGKQDPKEVTPCPANCLTRKPSIVLPANPQGKVLTRSCGDAPTDWCRIPAVSARPFSKYLINASLRLTWFEAVRACRLQGLNLIQLEPTQSYAPLAEALLAARSSLQGMGHFWSTSYTFDNRPGPRCTLFKKMVMSTYQPSLEFGGACRDRKLFICETVEVCKPVLNCSVKSTLITSATTLRSVGSETTGNLPISTTMKPALNVCSGPMKCPPKSECKILASYFLPNGTLNVPPNIGTFQKIWGKTYFFGTSNRVNMVPGIGLCCALNMSLLTVNTRVEGNALAKFYNGKKSIFITSYTDEGCKGTWRSCTHLNVTKPLDLKWGPNQPDNHLNMERCLAIELKPGEYSLSDRKCFETQYKYICEHNNEDFDPSLIEHVTSSCHSCDDIECKLNVEFAEAGAYCCSLGYRLLSFEDTTETNCVFEALTKIPLITFGKKKRLLVWTSGVDTSCNNSGWQWCLQGQPGMTSNGGDWRWGQGQPDMTKSDTGSCAHLEIKLSEAAFGSMAKIKNPELSNSNCWTKKKVICKEPPKSISNVNSGKTFGITSAAPEACADAKCPLAKCSARDKTMGKSRVSLRGIFEAQHVPACGKKYSFAWASQMFEKASDVCCALDYDLANIDSSEELECLKQVKQVDPKPGSIFWVGAVRGRQKKGWVWCNGEQEAQGKGCRLVPKGLVSFSKTKSAECLALELPKLGEPNLIPTPCTTNLRFICESRDPDVSRTTIQNLSTSNTASTKQGLSKTEQTQLSSLAAHQISTTSDAPNYFDDVSSSSLAKQSSSTTEQTKLLSSTARQMTSDAPNYFDDPSSSSLANQSLSTTELSSTAHKISKNDASNYFDED